MTCDRYWELISAQLDGGLAPEEAEELEAHLAACPACRAEQSRLAAIQIAFGDLEEVEAPEGFAQGVMERIRAEEKKVIPLFRRPQFRALAGLAACAVLVVGLYGASRQQGHEDIMVQGFSRSALAGDLDAAAGADEQLLDGVEESPMAQPYSETEQKIPSELSGAQKTAGEDIDREQAVPGPDGRVVPGGTVTSERPSLEDDVESYFTGPVERWANNAVLVLDRMPEGAEEYIPDELGAVSVFSNAATGEEGYRWFTGMSGEALAQIERLAQEQEISAERSSAPAEELLYDLVVLQSNG